MSNARKLADNLPTEGQLSNRNVLINGAMNIFQRASSATGVGSSGGYFSADRVKVSIFGTTAGRVTMAQNNDAPSGFNNSLSLSCTTTDTTLATGEAFVLRHVIEGQDLQRFAKGTSDAKEFTVSFYVKGNAAATYVCELYDSDNARQVSKSFSVTTSWTRVVLTFPADTTGAFTDDNGISLYLSIWLHSGSNFTSGTLNSTSWAANTNANRAAGISSFFDSTNRTFFLTGLQMEVGPQSTPFEHEPVGVTLSKCQRYFEKMTVATGHLGGVTGSGIASFGYDFSTKNWTQAFNTTKRAVPTVTKTISATNSGGSAATIAGGVNGVKLSSSNTGQYEYISAITADAEI